MPVEKKPGPTTVVAATDAIAEQLAALRDVLRGFVGNCELIDGQAQRYVLQYLQPSERPSAEPIPPFKVAKEEAASLVKLGEGVERIIRQLLPLVRSARPALEYGVKDAGPFATAVAEHLDAIWAAVAQYREQLNIVLESQETPSRITVRSWGQGFNDLAMVYNPIKGDLVPKLERYAARFGSVAVRPESESATPEQIGGQHDGGTGPLPAIPAAALPAPAIEAKPLQYAKLDQLAALVQHKKRTLQGYKNKGRPEPDIRGGGGKPDEWAYPGRIKPWLEETFGRQLPDHLPPDPFRAGADRS